MQHINEFVRLYLIAYAFQVYDASLPASTFSWVKQLREQMFESRDVTNVPVIVVANKVDVVADKSFNSSQINQHHNILPHLGSSLFH